MNRVTRFAAAVLGAAAVGGLLLWSYLAHREEVASEASAEKAIGGTARVTRGPGGDPVVKLDRDAQARADLRTEAVAEVTKQTEEAAYGRLEEDPSQSFVLRASAAGVLRAPPGGRWPELGQAVADRSTAGSVEPRLAPADRITLGDRLASARAEADSGKASLAAAQAALARARMLNADDRNVSDRAVQEAEARVAGEQARVAAAGRSVALIEAALSSTVDAALPLEVERGGEVVGVFAHPGESVESGQPVLRVVKYDTVLARIALPAGVSIDPNVRSARISPMGYGRAPLRGERVAIASAVDPKTQGQSFLFRIAAPSAGLRPGLAVTAWIEKPGPALRGIEVSRASVVRHAGKAWVYVRTADDSFARREVILEAPSSEGWFTRSLAPGDRIVTVGAEMLLSEELKSQIQVGEESQQ